MGKLTGLKISTGMEYRLSHLTTRGELLIEEKAGGLYFAPEATFSMESRKQYKSLADAEADAEAGVVKPKRSRAWGPLGWIGMAGTDCVLLAHDQAVPVSIEEEPPPSDAEVKKPKRAYLIRVASFLAGFEDTTFGEGDTIERNAAKGQALMMTGALAISLLAATAILCLLAIRSLAS